MLTIASKYFRCLFKTLLVMGILCSYLGFLLFVFKYSTETIIKNYTYLILFSIPWLIWFQQIFFSGIYFRKYYELNIKSIYISSLLSAAILMSAFPFVYRTPLVSPKNIKPNFVVSEKNIISSKDGTLFLPIKTTNNLFGSEKAKALWISDSIVEFHKISTNNLFINASDPYLLTLHGFSKSSGELDISHYSEPVYYKNPLGTYVIDLWTESAQSFNHFIYGSYQYNNISINHPSTNTGLMINRQKPSGVDHPEFSQITPNIKMKDPEKNSIDSIGSLIQYFRIFIFLYNTMLLASLIGIIFTINQNIISAFSLIIISSFLLPFYLPFINIVMNNKYISLPIIPELILLGVLSILCSIFVLVKYNLQEKKYAKDN